MRRVLLIGTIPPPIGGVSMHIQRFMDKYHTNSEFELDVLDLKKRKLYTRKRRMSLFQIIKKINYVDIVHLHISNDLKILIAFFSKLLRKKVIYTHHNIRVKNKTLFKVFMSFVDELILVNDNDIDSSIKEQYDYHLVPAFLPSLDQTKLPQSLENRLHKFDHVISTNCFEMTFIDDKDLYGFDLCVEAFRNLVINNRIKNTVLVLVDPSGTSKNYVAELLETYVSKNGCEILFVGERINFNALIQVSTMVLRATRSDGDSLSVREALYLGIPIIASDVTARPQGTICFQNEDSLDLAMTISHIVSQFSNPQSDHSVTYDNIDYGEAVLSIYRK